MTKEVRKIIFLGLTSLVILFGLLVYQSLQFSDNKLHVVFCNVGQGDGIFIRTPSGRDIIIDGGPNDSALSCLSNNMPFWDREIDLMFLTHPHADHFLGLISVLQRYSVLSFYTEKLENKTMSFKELLKAVKSEQGEPHYIFAGDRFKTKDGVEIRVLGPSIEYLKDTSPGGTIGESAEFASLVLHISYGEFDVLLTGDSQVSGIHEALTSQGETLQEVEVLQVPHHGSRFGLDKAIIDEINPKLAVISVGKNKYGHPSKEILDILRYKDIKILRTDQQGDIEIVSDGKSFSVTGY